MAATSVLASSSAITGSQGTSTSGSAAAAGAMCQVQCNNQNKELLPHRRSPAPMTTPVSTSSTMGQNPHSHPNSRMGAEGGSLASVNVLPQSVSSVLTGETSRSGSSASAALPMLTSSIIQAADNHHPVALWPAVLSFSKPDDSGVNNNRVHNDVACHQEQNDDFSASDEYLDDFNNAAGYETQQHTESNHIQGFNRATFFKWYTCGMGRCPSRCHNGKIYNIEA